MKNNLLLVGLMCLTSCTAYAQEKASELGTNSLAEVINAEKAFAKLAYEKDMQTSFIANMNDSSLLEIQGTLVRGLPLFKQMKPDTTGKIIWAPAFATISAAGDLGYTTGPYRYNIKGQDVAFGDFATVWQKQNKGEWKVVFDLGNTHPKPKIISTNVNSVIPQKLTTKSRSVDNLFKTDSTFNMAISLNKPVVELIHPQVHVLHDGRLAQIGRLAMEFIQQENKRYKFQSSGYKLAKSKDLGVVYGYCFTSSNGNVDKKGIYMHLWRLGSNNKWQLLHETIKFN